MTISRTVETMAATTYTDLGITASTGTTTTVTMDYDIASLLDFDGTRATAEFTLSVGGVALQEPFRLNFTYSGTGNPRDQAETELQSYFDRLDAAATADATTTADTTTTDTTTADTTTTDATTADTTTTTA